MSLQDIFGLTGKIAFMTGSGSDPGKATAEAGAEAGAIPVCFDRDADGLAETSASLVSRGHLCEKIAGVVTDDSATEAAIDEVDRGFSQLDTLFNNAGSGDPLPCLIHECRTQKWMKVVGINPHGAFDCSPAPVSIVVRQGSGNIVDTGSIWGLAGSSSVSPMPGYTANKGAVVNLPRELALQCADKNIQVKAIYPRFFVTKLGPCNESEFVEATTNLTPMKRLADPPQMKGRASYLVSSASSFAIGACFIIDGGCRAK